MKWFKLIEDFVYKLTVLLRPVFFKCFVLM